MKKIRCAYLLPLSIFLLLLPVFGYAQTISGMITGGLGQPISDATIHLLNTNLYTTTNANGYFSTARITPGQYTLYVTAAGYAAGKKQIIVGKDNVTCNMQLADALVELDEVVVRAQKKEELLQQAPMSITSLSAKQVQQYRLWNSRDLTGIVPNLYSNHSGDDRNVVSIRGIATTSYNPAVATYIDGVNQFSLDTYISSLNDIESIEVLRGPQGTLYGRNAMGGVITIHTKQPVAKTSGFAEISAGNYGQKRVSAGIRTPVYKNTWFLGSSFLLDQRNGYYENQFDGSSFDVQHAFSGNHFLRFVPSTRWSFTANFKHQNNRNKGAFPLINGLDAALAAPYQLNQNAIATMKDQTENLSFTAQYLGKQFQIHSQTAWQSNRRVYNAPLDGDFSPLDAVTVINDYGKAFNQVKVLTQEIRMGSASQTEDKLKWTAGMYFFKQNNPTRQGIHFGKDAGLLGIPDSNFAIINTNNEQNSGIAFYGQGNYRVGKKIELIAGLRYDYELRRTTVRGEFQKDAQPVFTMRPDTTASKGFRAVSPRLGILYHVNEQIHVFTNYSRGFRAGGLTQLSTDPSQPPLYPFEPEYSSNVEAGIKTTLFQNRLRFNFTAFLIDVSNAQVPTLVLPDAITVTRNNGKLTSKGVEVELAATPFKRLQVDVNFGYTDATYRSLFLSQNGMENDLRGRKQLFTPEMTAMTAVQYTYPLPSKKNLRLITRGEFRYLGKQYFDLANQIAQNGYGIVHVRAGLSSDLLDVFIWSRNLGNKKYVTYAYDFGAVHLGQPVQYGMSILLSIK